MNIKQKINTIVDHADQIIQVSSELSEQLIDWKPAPNEWSVKEVLCHVVEATSYWLNEIDVLVVYASNPEWHSIEVLGDIFQYPY